MDYSPDIWHVLGFSGYHLRNHPFVNPSFMTSIRRCFKIKPFCYNGYLSQKFHAFLGFPIGMYVLSTQTYFQSAHVHGSDYIPSFILRVGCPQLWITPVPGYPTLSTNIMARIWNVVPGLQHASTLGAAKSLAKKWAKDIPRWSSIQF